MTLGETCWIEPVNLFTPDDVRNIYSTTLYCRLIDSVDRSFGGMWLSKPLEIFGRKKATLLDQPQRALQKFMVF